MIPPLAVGDEIVVEGSARIHIYERPSKLFAGRVKTVCGRYKPLDRDQTLADRDRCGTCKRAWLALTTTEQPEPETRRDYT